MNNMNSSAAATHSSAHDRRFPVLELNEEHRIQAGMLCFICSEVAFFGTLIVAYITYLGQDTVGPTPAEVLRWPLVIAGTIALVSSSVTVHLASGALWAGAMSAFFGWLGLTILLGAGFLVATALEWHELIWKDGLSISTNLFGTTYFTLVGFHALHVTVGVLLLSLMFALAVRRLVSSQHFVGFEVVSWYWHFVDVVWIVVFSIVYLLGR
jgi:cytochrome c oxidase subunit 3